MDTARTIDEANRLRAEMDRPNVMIKVPATPEGIPAIEALVADGVNVNITLLFSMKTLRGRRTGLYPGITALLESPAGLLGRLIFRQPRRHGGGWRAERVRHGGGKHALG